MAAAGADLGRVLYGAAVGEALSRAIATTPAGAFIELGVTVGDGLGEIAVELGPHWPTGAGRCSTPWCGCTGWRARRWRRCPVP